MTDITTTLSAKDPRETMSRLRERQEQHAEQLAALSAERGGLALAAAEGDMDALERLRELDAEERTLHASSTNIEAALEHAEWLLQPILMAERNARRVAARAKAEEALAEYAAICVRCDEAIATAAKLLAERDVTAARRGDHRITTNDELWRQVSQDPVRYGQSSMPVGYWLAVAGFGRHLPMTRGPAPGEPRSLHEHALTLSLPSEQLCADPSP
jgi:hypothetical protein